MARRKMMSVDEGRELVARWKESGLSQTAFAKREQMDHGRISFWARRLRALDEGAVKKPAVARSFVRVMPRKEVTSPSPGAVEVVLREGLYVRVRGEVDDGLLRRVLAVAAELRC